MRSTPPGFSGCALPSLGRGEGAPRGRFLGRMEAGGRDPPGFIFSRPFISLEVLFTGGQTGIRSHLLPKSMFFSLNYDVSGKRNARLCV